MSKIILHLTILILNKYLLKLILILKFEEGECDQIKDSALKSLSNIGNLNKQLLLNIHHPQEEE